MAGRQSASQTKRRELWRDSDRWDGLINSEKTADDWKQQKVRQQMDDRGKETDNEIKAPVGADRRHKECGAWGILKQSSDKSEWNTDKKLREENEADGGKGATLGEDGVKSVRLLNEKEKLLGLWTETLSVKLLQFVLVGLDVSWWLYWEPPKGPWLCSKSG